MKKEYLKGLVEGITFANELWANSGIDETILHLRIRELVENIQEAIS